MSGLLLAEFSGADKLLKAARQARAAGLRAIDAFTPFVIDGLAKEIDLEIDVPRSPVRVAMFIGGVIVAALAYGTEWYSAVVDYPINSGGRPLNAWPAFMLVPFAVGILGAAVSGLITMLVQAGMPSLHHRLFEEFRISNARARTRFCSLSTGRGMNAVCAARVLGCVNRAHAQFGRSSGEGAHSHSADARFGRLRRQHDAAAA